MSVKKIIYVDADQGMWETKATCYIGEQVQTFFLFTLNLLNWHGSSF